MWVWCCSALWSLQVNGWHCRFDISGIWVETKMHLWNQSAQNIIKSHQILVKSFQTVVTLDTVILASLPKFDLECMRFSDICIAWIVSLPVSYLRRIQWIALHYSRIYMRFISSIKYNIICLYRWQIRRWSSYFGWQIFRQFRVLNWTLFSHGWRQ